MPVRILAFISFFLSVFFLAPAPLSAQIDDPEGVFGELRALEGTWFMPTDRGDRLEIWRIVDDSTLAGRGLRIRIENGDTVTLETLRLELRDTNITYSATVRGQNNNKPVVFKLTQADFDGYLFENPRHDDPQKILYRLLGNRELQVTTEGRRNGRVHKEEFVFEREFNPGAVEFRVRGGLNVFSLLGTGYLLSAPADNNRPVFSPRPGWEVGTAVAFKGRGGFITLNFELGLQGRFSQARADTFAIFPPDTTALLAYRDVTYNTNWLLIAFFPEITFKRDGRLSVFAGPYLGRLLFSRSKGTQLPGSENKLFDANSDFKKTDLGLLGGLQYKVNFGKKDVGGILGLRASLGLANIDNLYTRDRDNAALYNGQIKFTGLSLYYSMNLLKL
jgi:hypothetical protein